MVEDFFARGGRWVRLAGIARLVALSAAAFLALGCGGDSNATPELPGLEIARTVDGDQGKYYFIRGERSGDVVRSLHVRVGPDAVGYSDVETDCVKRQTRTLGYSEGSLASMKPAPLRQWANLVEGSSASDLAIFVCHRFRAEEPWMSGDQPAPAVQRPAIARGGDGCSPADFVVSDVSYSVDDNATWFVGVVKNIGTSACGVTLEASSFDSSGRLLDTEEFFPASTSNISPGGEERFKNLLDYHSSTAQIEVKPVRARRWNLR